MGEVVSLCLVRKTHKNRGEALFGQAAWDDIGNTIPPSDLAEIERGITDDLAFLDAVEKYKQAYA